MWLFKNYIRHFIIVDCKKIIFNSYFISQTCKIYENTSALCVVDLKIHTWKNYAKYFQENLYLLLRVISKEFR